MFNWLKRIVKQGRVIPPRIEPERETPAAQAPSITVAVLAAGVARKAVRFRSSALAQLWNEVGRISHPDYPFLDPLYSPGSLMPAADFSPWVAARIALGDWDSILEMLHFIGTDDQVTALRRTFQSYDFGRFIEADAALLSELQAIAILTYRIPRTGHEDNRLSLLAE